jgi:hypothetical protein
MSASAQASGLHSVKASVSLPCTLYCYTLRCKTCQQANIGEIASSVIGSSGDAVNAATAKTGSIVRNSVPKNLPDASELVPAEVISAKTEPKLQRELSLLC